MALNFQAFVDDSATPNGEFVLGGHIATTEAWVNFANEWEEMLPWGVRRDDGRFHFKMTQMAASPDRMSRVPAFYRIVEKYVAISVSCRMNLAEFEQAKADVLEQASMLNIDIELNNWANPYYFQFRSLMDTFHEARFLGEPQIPLSETVDFYFDNQTEKSVVFAAWDGYLKGLPQDIAQSYGVTPRFEDDMKFLPLQAADLWAWWVREWYEEEAAPVPVKMEQLDFGSWKGQRRPQIVMSHDLQQMKNRLWKIIMASASDATLNGEPIFRS